MHSALGQTASRSWKDLVVVNFTYHCDKVTGCLDIWPGISFNESEWKFLDEFNSWTGKLCNTDCPPQCGSPHPISWRSESNRKAKNELLLPDCLRWTTGLLPLDLHWKFRFSWLSSFVAFGLNLHHWLLLASSLPSADLGLLSLLHHISQFLVICHVNIFHIIPIFLGNTGL